MDQKKTSPTQELIETLRREVENHINRRMITPSDFRFLAQALQSTIRRNISPTTLKRVWGYIRDTGDDYSPGRYTLCSLAQFIGFRDIEEFQYTYSGDTILQSDHYFGMTIGCDEIPDGAIVEITWQPNRRIQLLHISGNDFKVIFAENSKLHEGDRIECHSFTQNAPLYISRVIRPNAPTSTYVAGSHSGVRYRIPSTEHTD